MCITLLHMNLWKVMFIRLNEKDIWKISYRIWALINSLIDSTAKHFRISWKKFEKILNVEWNFRKYFWFETGPQDAGYVNLNFFFSKMETRPVTLKADFKVAAW